MGFSVAKIVKKLLENKMTIEVGRFKDNIVQEFYLKHFSGNDGIIQLIRTVYSIPPTSASVERLFSTSGIICTPTKSRLSEETIEMMTVIRFYLQNLKSEDARKKLLERIFQKINGNFVLLSN